MEESKKAGIVTIYDPNPNYGNRLQNYAVQETLKKLGLEVETLSFEQSKINFKVLIKYYLQKISGYKLPGEKNFWKLYIPKVIKFENFNKKYIKTVKINNLKEIREKDFFVVGSDQVWNPEWYEDCKIKKEMYLLTFADDSKKICFSPSFSVEKLPSKWEEWFKVNLNKFPRLSVREDTGAKIIENLTGRKAEVLIDPTLMLSKEEWKKLSADNKITEKDYILTYFLGGRDEKTDEDFKKYSKELDTKVYNLLDYSQPDIYTSDPCEFVNLIDNAKLVVTDSFHACVFSFIFKKPFLLYNRIGKSDMMSRMDTFLKKFKLERKYIFSKEKNELLECEYEQGYEILKQEQKKVYKFLEDCVKN